jgi:hypothetical protein
MHHVDIHPHAPGTADTPELRRQFNDPAHLGNTRPPPLGLFDLYYAELSITPSAQLCFG